MSPRTVSLLVCCADYLLLQMVPTFTEAERQIEYKLDPLQARIGRLSKEIEAPRGNRLEKVGPSTFNHEHMGGHSPHTVTYRVI